jgi:hypothetical protein
MRLAFIIAALPLLAACSQQSMCIARATKDLRVVQNFIAISEANLDRGYALVSVETIEYKREVCAIREDGRKRYCKVPYETEKTVPKSIDLNAEAAKLTSLRDKEAILSVQAKSSIGACRQTYPDA